MNALPNKGGSDHYVPSLNYCKSLWNMYSQDSAILHNQFVISLITGNENTYKDFYHFINHEISLLDSYVSGLRLSEKYLVEDDKVRLTDKFTISMLIGEINKNKSFLTKTWGAKCRFPVNQLTENCKNLIINTSSGQFNGNQGMTASVAVYTLVTMLPHLQFLEFLGEHIGLQHDKRWMRKITRQDTKLKDHPFKEWLDYVNYYSNTITHLVENLVDSLIECSSSDALNKLFFQSLDLTERFILSLNNTQNSFLPVLKNSSDTHLFFFSSFFSTCTQQIVNPLFRLEFDVHSEIIEFWGLRTREECPLYHQLIDAIIADIKPVRSYSYDVLKRKMDKLSFYEKQVPNVLIELDFFVGLSRETIEQDGENLSLKEGCISFLKRLTEREDVSASIHVISRCWCTDLIESAFFQGDVHHVDIHSNEFSYEGDTSTGVVRKVESAVDKISTFESILRNSAGERRKLKVYVGSTVSDLLCLLNADIGIVVGTNDNLRRLGSHFGVTFIPLFDLLVEKQNEVNEERRERWIGGSLGRVYTVTCWAQVQSFLVGF